MRLLPLDVGRIDAAAKVVTGEDGTITLPIVSWLIEHPAGLVLFDNGMHVELQHDVTRLGRTASAFRPVYEPGDEVSAKLSARGIRPSDVTHMIFSHLHFDHVGGTEQLPDARVISQRTEWEAGQDSRLIEQGVYNPDDYNHGHDLELVDGEHDVFGDGRLVCIPTPGHTAGHQSLRVELDSGPVILTADCVYFERMLDDMLVPRFGHDLDQQRESMRTLGKLRDSGCRLLYGHDKKQLSTLPTTGLS
ncbi:MAG: N-acyl homoserine lactonase family protein [Actinomycetota bacterium]